MERPLEPLEGRAMEAAAIVRAADPIGRIGGHLCGRITGTKIGRPIRGAAPGKSVPCDWWLGGFRFVRRTSQDPARARN
jgi:hypothetical protein